MLAQSASSRNLWVMKARGRLRCYSRQLGIQPAFQEFHKAPCKERSICDCSFLYRWLCHAVVAPSRREERQQDKKTQYLKTL